MNSFKKPLALLASVVVLGATAIAMMITPASADTPPCVGGCTFNFAQPSGTSSGPFELGVKFSSDISGYITAICFWEAPGETGTHTVRLWNSVGTQVASATGGGTPGAKNCFAIAPIVIDAGQTFTASYSDNTAFLFQAGGFNSSIDAGHLHAAVGAGLYNTPGSLPVNNFSNSNYGVDVVLSGALQIRDCTSTLTAPTKLTTAPGDASATVSWAPASSDPDGCIAGYVVTPSLGGVAQPSITIPGPGTTTVIKGLTNGGSYTFTVAAESGTVVGPQSTATTAITVGTAAAAALVHASHAAKGAVRVGFRAPSGNGAAVTSYAATCRSSNGGVAASKSGTSSPITVTGLSAGKTYTCVVRASNSRGTGPTSARSAAAKA